MAVIARHNSEYRVFSEDARITSTCPLNPLKHPRNRTYKLNSVDYPALWLMALHALHDSVLGKFEFRDGLRLPEHGVIGLFSCHNFIIIYNDKASRTVNDAYSLEVI